MARAAGSSQAEPGASASATVLGLTALSGATVTVLFGPVIGLPVAGVALASLVLSRRAPVATMAIVLGAGLAAFIAESYGTYVVGVPLTGVPLTARAPYVFGALMAALLVTVGPLAARLLARRSALETAAILTAVILALEAVALWALANGAGQRVGTFVAAAMQSMGERLGSGTELTEALLQLWPSMLVSATGIVALFVVMGIGWVAARQGIELHRVPRLSGLDLDPRCVLVPIVGIALLALGAMQGSETWLSAAGDNVLVVASWLFFLQGVAVFAGIAEKVKIARIGRGIGFVLLLLVESFVPVVSILGLADVWLNIRRLPRNATGASEPDAPQA